MKAAILIPVYNEEFNIKGLMTSLNLSGYDYLIVNDGSTDFTDQMLMYYQANYVNYHINQGKGFAIKYGAKKLIEQGYDYIITVDGDGQMDLTQIKKFILLAESDPNIKMIIGNRLNNAKNMPKLRYYTNRFMSWIISKINGQYIPDTQCGYRLYHRDIFDLELEGNRFDFESEAISRVIKKGFKVSTTDVKCIYNSERKSKINPIKDTWRFIKLLIKLYLYSS